MRIERIVLRLGLIASVGVAGCDAAPEADPADPAIDESSPPAWLNLEPNHRREESSRLASQAIAECNRQVPLDSLRSTLDSIRSHYGVEPAETRSHPEAARQLDLLLERQNDRRACLDASPLLQRSRAIVSEAPAEFDLPVYAAPDSTSERVGTIRIARDESEPGPHRLVLTFRRSDAEPVEWVSDRRQFDGYGGYYHTVLEQRGDWLLLPADPFPTPIWIDWRSTFRSPPLIEPLFGDVYSMTEIEAEIAGLEPPTSWDSPGIVFVRSESGHSESGRTEAGRMWFRLEGPQDLSCSELRSENETDARLGTDGREYPIDTEQLVDDRGHLRLQVKYARGC